MVDRLLPGGAEGEAIRQPRTSSEPDAIDRNLANRNRQTQSTTTSNPGSGTPVGQDPTDQGVLVPGLSLDDEVQWELWQDQNGIAYLVWMVPGIDPDEPPIPMAYQIPTTDEYDRLLGRTDVTVDRTVNAAQMASSGMIVLGTSHMLDAGELTEVNAFDRWVEAYRKQAELMPWLRDPELFSLLVGVQLLENREVTEEELAATEWYQTHSAAEVAWLETSVLDPEGAADVIESNRIIVRNQLRDAGINNASDELVNTLADKMTTGQWTSTQGAEQIALLADPYRQGDIDESLKVFQAGLDTTAQSESEVRALISTWLGPMHAANYTPGEISRLAGEFRNDPDASDRFIETLKDQRLNLFPAYSNRDATYEQIAAPWRNLFFSTWGQQADELDPVFSQILNLNDAGESTRLLRREGLKRGIKTVTDEALSGLLRSTGGSVRPSSGAIT